MSKVYRDHCTETVLDFGDIGERHVDVFYDWHEPNPSNDPLQVPENGGVVVKDVRVFLDGSEISILHWLTPSRVEDLSDQIRKKWL